MIEDTKKGKAPAKPELTPEEVLKTLELPEGARASVTMHGFIQIDR